MSDVIMDNGYVENENISIEKNDEPYFIINCKSCKFSFNKNGLEQCDLLKLHEILKTKNVSCFDLSNCILPKFPPNFCTLDNIIELNLSGNELKTLPDEFGNLKKLRDLNISQNKFSEFPSVFYNGLHLIKILNVSNNNINLINKTPPCCIHTLQYLDLSSNILSEPPHWLINEIPACLKYIDLSNNPCFEKFSGKKISSSHEKVADCVKTLKISNCKFQGGIENYLFNFSNLCTLNLGNSYSNILLSNYITELRLPGSIEELLMPEVGLASISNGITNLKNLRQLDISGNNIHWLPASIINLRKLVILRAEHCSLYILPCEMNELTSLKELYLSSNQLSSAEGFENLINLEILDLYGNQLISLPNFLQFSKLTALDLCQNYVEPPSLIEVSNLKYIYEDLKTCLRSKIQNCSRNDGAKEFSTIPENENEEFSDWSSDNDLVQSDLEDFPIEQTESNCLDHQEEFWETDENEVFDPNVWDSKNLMPMTKNLSNDSLTGEIPFEVTTHPHYFTPYQLVSPTIINKNSLPPPVEGQFDD